MTTTKTPTQKLVTSIGVGLFDLAKAIDPLLLKLGLYHRLLISARMDDLCRTHEELCHECDMMHMWQTRTSAHMLHVAAYVLRKSKRATIRDARRWLAKRRLS